MRQGTTVIIVKSIHVLKMTQEHMAKHRIGTNVRGATAEIKTQGLRRVIERKRKRPSVKMSIKNGWTKLCESMKTSKKTTSDTDEEYF